MVSKDAAAKSGVRYGISQVQACLAEPEPYATCSMRADVLQDGVTPQPDGSPLSYTLTTFSTSADATDFRITSPDRVASSAPAASRCRAASARVAAQTTTLVTRARQGSPAGGRYTAQSHQIARPNETRGPDQCPPRCCPPHCSAY